MKKNLLLFAVVFSTSFLFAGRGDWIGQLFINNQLAPDGTLVCAYVNGVENSRTSVGAYGTGYYLLTVVGEPGDNVTFSAFCDSDFMAKQSAIWMPSPPRNQLNLNVSHASIIGSPSSINYSGPGSLSLQINGSAPSSFSYYNNTQTVSIFSSYGVLVKYDFDFSNHTLNLSKISISSGSTSDGKSYLSVYGANATGGLASKKTFYIYNANDSYNGLCVKDAEGATHLQISSSCSGSSEVQVACPGTSGGITCNKTGSTLQVSGLTHSAVIQFSIPSPAPPAPSGTTAATGGATGGGGGGGGGGSSSTKKTIQKSVDIGIAVCPVEIKREISSSNVSSVLTTIIENKGIQDCRMEEFVFADTIPDNFASINEILFSPEYSSREGWKVFFNFPSFNPGESKAITYTVERWVPPSRVDEFKEPELSAKKKAITPPSSPTQQNQQQPSTAQTQQPTAKPEEKKPAPETPQPNIPLQPAAGSSPSQFDLATAFISEQIAELGPFILPVAFVVGLIIAIASVAYMVVKRKGL